MSLDPEIHKLLVRKTVGIIDKMQDQLAHEMIAHVISMNAQGKTHQEIGQFLNEQMARRITKEATKIVDMTYNTIAAPDALANIAKLKIDPEANPDVTPGNETKH